MARFYGGAASIVGLVSEPPSPDGRRSRSDAAARLAALFSDVDPSAPVPPEPAPGRGGRDEGPADGDLTVVHDLRALDRLWGEKGDAVDPLPVAPAPPVEDDAPPAPPGDAPLPIDDDDDGPPVADEGTVEGPPLLANPPVEGPEGIPEVLGKVFAESDESLWAPGSEDGDVADEEVAGPFVDLDPGDAPAPRRRVTLRAVAFGVAFALLVVAIPLLGAIGVQRLGNSRGGTLQGGNRQPDEVGYLALVAPTRTALLVHRDDEGNLASATLLALGAGDVGGTVIQIPLTTQIRDGAFLVTMVGQAFEGGDMERFQRVVEDRLNLAVQERIELSDGQIAELVRPVAPLAIENPDDVVLPDGRTFASGAVELTAEDVGPFLRSGEDSEAELARLARDEVVWSAWLTALGAAGDGAATVSANLRPFLEALAAGTREGADATLVETLDVGAAPDGSEALVPGPGFDAQLNAAVPFPQSSGPGRRYALKLLNGVEGAPLPEEVMHALVAAGASLVQVGNGGEFGQDTTSIEITGPEWREAAEAAKFVFGGTGRISTMSDTRAAESDVDVVITVGRDVLTAYEERAGG